MISTPAPSSTPVPSTFNTKCVDFTVKEAAHEEEENKEEEEEEEECFGLESLFVNENYTLKSFFFSDPSPLPLSSSSFPFEQSLLCSSSNSTRHDLTGQIGI